MPAYQPPRNDVQRLALLRQAAAVGAEGLADGESHIGQGTLADVLRFLPLFEEALSNVRCALSARAEANRERNAAQKQVQIHVRHLWAALKNRIRRLGQSVEVLTLYGLPLSGIVPNPGNWGEWQCLTEQVIWGDREAQDAGYPVVTNPSAAELQTVLELAQARGREATAAKVAYRQAQETAAVLRPQANELVAQVIADLRHSLHKSERPARRCVMRLYGIHFRRLPAEPADLENVER